MDLQDRVEALSKELVKADSVVGSPGEAKIAKLIHRRLSGLPYFIQHPERLILQRTENDTLVRYNVIAFLKGQKAKNNEALLLLGHMDTVGIEDYQNLKEYAFDSDLLKTKLKDRDFKGSLKKEIEDPNWQFGRGLLDMKSGLASQILALEAAAEDAKNFEGNLFFLAECDEEDNSKGILSALPLLEKLCLDNDLVLKGAINADYTAPRYPGDQKRYLYYGTVGKQLPAFYIVGKETHVGDPFAGLDPNFLAALLLKELSYNPDYCDIAGGEVSTPPISLKLQDFKTFYTVQTNVSALVYFNFAVHKMTAAQVLTKMKEAAAKAIVEGEALLQERYERYSDLNNLEKTRLNWQTRILTYEEIKEAAFKAHGAEFLTALEKKAEELALEEIDLRDYNIKLVQFVWQFLPDQSPAIIIFFGSMYYPAIALDLKRKEDAELINAAEKAIKELNLEKNYEMSTRFFFPYIADASFLSLNDDEASLKAYLANYPADLKKQKTDFQLINRLSMPVINIGAYGKDAHQFLERIDAAYTFGIIPGLIQETIRQYFKNKQG